LRVGVIDSTKYPRVTDGQTDWHLATA